jgi:hypothetical protein
VIPASWILPGSGARLRFDKRVRNAWYLEFAWSWVMPVTYSIDATRRLIHTVCARPLTFAQVMDHFRELKEDPACSGRLDVLLDVSDADLVPEGHQLVAVSGAIRSIRDKVQFGLCAVVAGRDAMFGMMRVFEVRAGDHFGAIHVFRETAEAEIWLASQKIATGAGSVTGSRGRSES